MHTVPTIPGVKLEVYKQTRLLQPEADGYVGQLHSGSATILAIVDPEADPTISYLRDGQDHYSQVIDWIDYVNQDAGNRAGRLLDEFLERQQRKASFLEGREFVGDTKVYGTTMSLRVYAYNCKPLNTVNYPDNTLAVAQFVRQGEQLTGRVHVWEVALVSQNGDFFLTVHRHYNIPACKSVSTGRICFPRLQKHRPLENLLVENAPENLPLVPAEDIVSVERTQVQNLGRYEGIVESWYAPCNVGTILTAKGPAKVHWTEVPCRPRRRFLEEGERVRFAELRVPPVNPGTKFRKVRKASHFELSAYGIEVARVS